MAIILNALLVTATGVSVQYVAPSLYHGYAAIGFQGTAENGIEHLFVTINQITFEGGTNTSDAAYRHIPVTLDLVSLNGVTRVLEDARVSPGQYTMIQFHVIRAVAVIHGQKDVLKVQDREVVVPVRFDVSRGQTTTIVLTMSANNFLIIYGDVFKPVITEIHVIGPN
jgi:hypothetical protein